MQKNISLKLLPSEAADTDTVKKYLARHEGLRSSRITGYNVLKHSIDARGKQPWVNLGLQVFIDEPYHRRDFLHFNFKDVQNANRQVIIAGAGPAGLFAALKLIEEGIRPIIIERGKEVRARRRDLAILNKEGEVNPESNYCFGEGGAGTYSDGKLYTRSSKRGDINRILNLFVHFGAEEKILYESHPHIGTNKLPQIITAMRKKIIECGGMIRFETRLVDFRTINDRFTAAVVQSGEEIPGEALILATGHSARDIFQLLFQKKLLVGIKSFALGVRVEHPQSLIDTSQYHCSFDLKNGIPVRPDYLPPASYSVVQQVNGKGVFSFCMCPGGIIAPAATSPGELVVNGWSPSKRNNPFANSGIVVSIEEKDLRGFSKHGPLAGMYFQKSVEQKAFNSGGGRFVAPAMRLVDFTESKLSSSLPACSYLPGIRPAPLKEVLPGFVYEGLQTAFKEFGKKMKGYLTNEAVVVATESRTSSPVRIPRDNETLEHPQVRGLYPCGEGAGYAGGIVSAAMDGERLAAKISIASGNR